MRSLVQLGISEEGNTGDHQGNRYRCGSPRMLAKRRERAIQLTSSSEENEAPMLTKINRALTKKHSHSLTLGAEKRDIYSTIRGRVAVASVSANYVASVSFLGCGVFGGFVPCLGCPTWRSCHLNTPVRLGETCAIALRWCRIVILSVGGLGDARRELLSRETICEVRVFWLPITHNMCRSFVSRIRRTGIATLSRSRRATKLTAQSGRCGGDEKNGHRCWFK